MDEPSKAPTGLRAPGKLLWAAVIDKYVLTAAEVEMLGQACRTTDELDRLERAVRVLPELTTTGSTGQLKPHPLLEEVRRHRTLLERLTTALALPDEDQTVGLRGASRHAQRRREPVGAAVGEECLMAMHRRPPGVEPPAELFEFRLEEWQAPDDLDWEAAFQRWTTARRAWVAEHPDSALGNRLDLLRGERRARFGNLGWHQSDVSRLRGV